jgi:hypothetical protein
MLHAQLANAASGKGVPTRWPTRWRPAPASASALRWPIHSSARSRLGSALYSPKNRRQRKATWSPETPEGHWRVYECDELIARNKASLDIFWLKDDSVADSDNLPPPEVIVPEIVDDLEAALEQFLLIATDLAGDSAT